MASAGPEIITVLKFVVVMGKSAISRKLMVYVQCREITRANLKFSLIIIIIIIIIIVIVIRLVIVIVIVVVIMMIINSNNSG